jgi:geranylgeranyl diphosphate synthase, type I
MDGLKAYNQVLKKELSKFFEEDLLITKDDDLKIYDLLKEYSLRGKFVRGSLVLLVSDALSGKISDDALITATALEVLHSSILVIDDIIDKDDLRRGMPSMHVMVKDLIPFSKDKVHDAQSIAQCVGLIGTYCAYRNLSRVNRGVFRLLSEEFVRTGFAELNEIILSQRNVVTDDDVLNIYRFKTARYTITLPFRLAFVLCEQLFSDELERITDNIGILFQFKDDLLELEHNSDNIGKSNTSDIKSGKQHFPRKLLEISVSEEDSVLLNDYYSKLDDDSVLKIKELYTKYNIVGKTNEIIDNLKDETLDLIEKQDVKLKPLLKNLLNYVINRSY